MNLKAVNPRRGDGAFDRRVHRNPRKILGNDDVRELAVQAQPLAAVGIATSLVRQGVGILVAVEGHIPSIGGDVRGRAGEDWVDEIGWIRKVLDPSVVAQGYAIGLARYVQIGTEGQPFQVERHPYLFEVLLD